MFRFRFIAFDTVLLIEVAVIKINRIFESDDSKTRLFTLFAQSKKRVQKIYLARYSLEVIIP